MFEPKSGCARAVPLPLALSKVDRQRLIGFIKRRVRNPEDVADLMQEVLTRALSKPPEAIKDPLSYLQGIAWNVVCDYFKNNPERGTVVFDSTLADESAEQSSDAVANALADHEALTAQMDAEQMVREALGYLSRRHRQVLLLTMGAGLSYEEAAQELKLSVHTIKKYVYEAKSEIRERMSIEASVATPRGEDL